MSILFALLPAVQHFSIVQHFLQRAIIIVGG